MIKIERTDCPVVLKKGRKYNHKDVVKELWDMQHEKCCYCEHDIPEEGHSKAVEHFAPKSIFKNRENDWYNLLLACGQCNGKKSNKFPVILSVKEDDPEVPKVIYIKQEAAGITMIINPSEVNPEPHISFITSDKDYTTFGLVTHNDELGKLTIEVIGLYRDFYKKKNRKHLLLLRQLHTRLLEARIHNDDTNINYYRRDFETQMSANREHAALTRAFVREHNLDTDFQIRVLREAEVV